MTSNLALLLALALGQTDTSKPNLIPDSFDLKWQLKQGDTFRQELTVQQRSVHRVQGLLFNTGLQYRVLSAFTVEKVSENGDLQVTQKIEEATLLQADALTQPLVMPQLKQMPGTVFTLHFNKQMEVTKFDAPPLQPAIGRNAMGLQMASLMDRDGWKEMAEVFFLQPNRPLKKTTQWDRSITHSWGDLGKWTGKMHYRYEGKKKSVHQIAYTLKVTHQAPKGGADKLIGKANFQAQVAQGNIHFDADQNKVTAAEERFLVRGALEINLLGQKTPVEIEEEQLFKLRLVR